jgi:hypothetical protein
MLLPTCRLQSARRRESLSRRELPALAERIEIWRQAIRRLIGKPEGRRLELLDDGTLIPWEEGPQNSWIAKLPLGR